MFSSIQDALVAADDAMFDASKELYVNKTARRAQQKKKLDEEPLDKCSTTPAAEGDAENRTSPRGSKSTYKEDFHEDDPVAEFYRTQALKAEAENKLPAKDWARNFPSYLATDQKLGTEIQKTGLDCCMQRMSEPCIQDNKCNDQEGLPQKGDEKQGLDVQAKTSTMRRMLKERLIGVLYDDFIGGVADDQRCDHD